MCVCVCVCVLTSVCLLFITYACIFVCVAVVLFCLMFIFKTHILSLSAMKITKSLTVSVLLEAHAGLWLVLIWQACRFLLLESLPKLARLHSGFLCQKLQFW